MRSKPWLCLALILTGCGDGDSTHPGGTGTLEVTTVSTGEGLDTDGYGLEVVGWRTLEIGTNATVTLTEVPASEWEVRLTGVRENCTVQGPHPRLIQILEGETSHTQFEVACAGTPLLDRIVFYSNRNGTYNLYSMNADGSDPKPPRADDGAGEEMPSWSPAGSLRVPREIEPESSLIPSG